MLQLLKECGGENDDKKNREQSQEDKGRKGTSV
jgi:hypothetical protein